MVESIEEISEVNGKVPYQKIVKNTFTILFVMFSFLVALKMMGISFKSFEEYSNELIKSTSNPFVGLFIGLLATAIIQSSSATTSMIVMIVATGTLELSNAIPMIMGANIGTSVTSTIVSMGHIGKKKEFRKAISAATVHDFFNIMVVIILFPLEVFFNFMSEVALSLTSLFSTEKAATSGFSIMKYTVKPVANFLVKDVMMDIYYITIPAALVLLLVSLHFLTKILKSLVIGKAQAKMDSILFQNPFKSMFWGTFITAGVQSSSVTSSLIVPLVATNKVSLRKAFPFLIGANIGTTITALIASLSADNKHAALSVAFAHVMFNVLGAAIVFPLKPLRDIPVMLSRKLGRATLKNRFIGFAYVGVTFFLIPFILILLSDSSMKISEYSYKKSNLVENTTNYDVIVEEKKDAEIKRKYYENLESNDIRNLDKSDYDQSVTEVENIFFLGKEFYFIEEKGYCWDEGDMNGKFNVCIEKVINNFKLSDNIKAKQCIVYNKRYYSADTLLNARRITFIDVEEKLILKEEVYNESGKLIENKELVSKN